MKFDKSGRFLIPKFVRANDTFEDGYAYIYLAKVVSDKDIILMISPYRLDFLKRIIVAKVDNKFRICGMQKIVRSILGDPEKYISFIYRQYGKILVEFSIK